MDTPLRGTCLAGKALAVSLETTTSLSSERRTITTFTSGLHRHHVSIRQHQVKQFVEQPLHVLSEGHHYGDIRSVRYSAQSGLLACAGQGPVQLWSANARNN